jgi:hypothetical protein
MAVRKNKEIKKLDFAKAVPADKWFTKNDVPLEMSKPVFSSKISELVTAGKAKRKVHGTTKIASFFIDGKTKRSVVKNLTDNLTSALVMEKSEIDSIIDKFLGVGGKNGR